MMLIGTSGYDYPELKGIFYPADMPRKDFLPYYASIFNALELNSTFYGMPTAERMISFYERAQNPDFKFCVKANQLLTHQIDKNWKNYAADFKSAVLPLLEKNALADILVQFPESFHYTPENRFYLSDLINELKDFPTVIEFRHKEWIRDSVLEGLNKRNTGIVFCDMPQLKNLPNGMTHEKSARLPFIGDTAYIRFHGRNNNAWYAQEGSVPHMERYNYEYSEDELKSFIPVIRTAEQMGKKVQMYFNNHPNGNGFKNAMLLMELLREK